MLNGSLPPFHAAILDMDGLVLDSESTYCHAWCRAASDLGIELSEAFCHGLFGRHADDVARAFRAKMGAAFEPERFHRLAERHWRDYLDTHGMDRMPGLEALLAVFRNREIPYALATNSDGIYARQCLRLAGLEAEFPVIVTRDQVPLGKPEPDVFLEAARRLETPSGLCLGVEDSATGLAAARAAGTITVLVQRREEVRRQLAGKADLALTSLAELADLIEPS
ncbi:HAD family hydrolase [Methylomagnum sp.]